MTYSTKEAEEALNAWRIPFTRQPNGTLLVPGDLNLAQKQLEKLPDLSCVEVTGAFDCSYNYLSTLEGAPFRMHSLICAFNYQLYSLQGAPRELPGNFAGHSTGLGTLEGGPETVHGSYIVSKAWLETLKGGPTFVGLDFDLRGNKLGSLDWFPRYVGETINVQDNPLPSLKWLEGHNDTIYSPFGRFDNWDAVPDEFRGTPQERHDALRAQVRKAFAQGLPAGSRMPPRAIFRKENSGTKTPQYLT